MRLDVATDTQCVGVRNTSGESVRHNSANRVVRICWWRVPNDSIHALQVSRLPLVPGRPPLPKGLLTNPSLQADGRLILFCPFQESHVYSLPSVRAWTNRSSSQVSIPNSIALFSLLPGSDPNTT